MYFQLRYLEESKTFGGTSGLDTIELPNAGMLSGIEFRVWGSCGTGADKPDVWLHDRLTKIELVVNGSQVVKSYSGDQLLAMMLYKRTPIMSVDNKNMSGAACSEGFYINLGLFYHDLEHSLDLSKVNDPELRFTYDFTKTTQNGWANGVAMSAAPSRSVICHVLKDAPEAPKGYIKTSELYRHTSGQSKKENMTVPRGPVYSNMYLQSWYTLQGLGLILDKVELNLNMSEVIPVRLGPIELASQNLRQYGLFKFIQQMSVAGGQAYPAPLEEGFLANVRVGLTDAEAGAVDLWANYSNIPLRQTSDGTTAVTGNVTVQAVFEGIWPFSVAAIPYFDPTDKRTWLDTKPLGDIVVRVEETASASTNLVLKLLGDEVVTTYL